MLNWGVFPHRLVTQASSLFLLSVRAGLPHVSGCPQKMKGKPLETRNRIQLDPQTHPTQQTRPWPSAGD